jgi:hypothetical protein
MPECGDSCDELDEICHSCSEKRWPFGIDDTEDDPEYDTSDLPNAEEL